ncbi:TetR/AcrR family transcriptional regulator [Nocardia sp. NPDC051833]|uniref:TetR/AcrR family transcriptional regulator n=1 Tax=Nocardia sp. NPDC051833 TaxID=3155674 RepID=UPI003443FB07
MQRVNRVESKQQTRKLIIEAATAMFLEQGFRATSLVSVAARAGYTVGAVYSNFANKAALGTAVLDELYIGTVDRVIANFGELDAGNLPALLDSAEVELADVLGNLAWVRLELEVLAADPNEEALRAAIAHRQARMRQAIATAWRSSPALAGRLDPELAALAFVGLAYGIGAQRAMDPRIPAASLTDVLRALIPVAPLR